MLRVDKRFGWWGAAVEKQILFEDDNKKGNGNGHCNGKGKRGGR
jgi:hypothetical protein